jgi:cell division transport system ATP-binding protein
MADKPTRGEVRVSGYSSTRIKSREIALLRRKIGYVFQDFRLLGNRTAADNVAFALEVTGARRTVIRSKVGKLLAMVGLAAKAEAYPHELSGGEQQRVAVARALVHDPLVLLADEPTGNLDERSTRGIFDLVRTINTAGTAVLFATHNLELVRGSPQHRVMELDHGTIVYDSAPTEV